MDNVTLSDNTDAHRFELRMDGVVGAYSEYRLLKGAVLPSRRLGRIQLELDLFQPKPPRFDPAAQQHQGGDRHRHRNQ